LDNFVVPQGLVVFSKNNCPACNQLKDKLKFQNKVFTEINIQENSAAQEFIINKGFRSMPVVFLDGESVSVFKVVN
jgi:glutaredoxin